MFLLLCSTLTSQSTTSEEPCHIQYVCYKLMPHPDFSFATDRQLDSKMFRYQPSKLFSDKTSRGDGMWCLQKALSCLSLNMSFAQNLGSLSSFHAEPHTHTCTGLSSTATHAHTIQYIYHNCTVVRYFGIVVTRSLWSSWQWCQPHRHFDKITSTPNSIRSPL